MPPNNCDPLPTPPDRALGDSQCPKCGAEMEAIEMGAEGLALQGLQLCPACYLVTWTDQDGPHIRQGVPVPPGNNSDRGPDASKSGSLPGEPEEC